MISHQVSLPKNWIASSCILSPWEVAQRCHALGQLVFLDHSLQNDSGLSLVACLAQEIIKGSDPKVLEATLDEFVFNQEIPMLAVGKFHYEGNFHFGLYTHAALFDHTTNQWWHCGDLLNNLPQRQPQPEASPFPFQPQIEKPDFCNQVKCILDYIRAGDIYQANISQSFTADWQGSPLAFYDKLRHCSPNPYAAYLEAEDEIIFSASPELFLDMRGHSVTTRPIKGTRPRGKNFRQDEILKQELLNSTKEAAELLMITDLERNDLGQICKISSVHVPELKRLESYRHVYHLVSTVTGALREDVNHFTALQACFPGGSITGTPKKRAMEIIRELEKVPRGIYTGSIGCFGLGDRSVFNIAIRTASLSQGKISFRVGAGIVADSQPEHEYEETLAKAAGFLAASGQSFYATDTTSLKRML